MKCAKFTSPTSLWAIFLLSLWTSLLQAGEVTFRYYRWTPTQFRFQEQGVAEPGGGNFPGTHISEFEFLFNGERLPGAIVTNPEGEQAPGAEVSEGPAQVNDGDTGTKWFDRLRQPLVFDFGQDVSVNGYRWATANAAPLRDPVRWIIEGSDDISNPNAWIEIDDRTATAFDAPMPDGNASDGDRFTFTPVFEIQEGVDIDLTLTSSGVETRDSLNVPANQPLTLNWTIANATSATLTGASSAPNPLSVSTISDSPSATTTYILTATNAVTTVSREITAFVGANAEPLIINEFLTDQSRDGGLCDEDGSPSDWIEIFNPNSFAIGLGGLYLTADPTLGNRWRFPPGVTLASEEYLIVFASGKDRAPAAGELHTDFTLTSESGFLALLESNGSTVIEEFRNYPAQTTDVSFGHVPPASGNTLNIFTQPTPGAANTTPPGPLSAEIQFSVPSRSFEVSESVVLSTSDPSAQIIFTQNGSLPEQGAAGTFVYSGPINIATSTIIRARTIRSGFAPGPVATESYFLIQPDLQASTFDLPVVVIDTFNQTLETQAGQTGEASFALFEPDSTSGVTSLLDTPSVVNRVQYEILRPNGDAKRSFGLTFLSQDSADENDVELLGFSEAPKWRLEAPFVFDRSLIRYPFMHQLANEVGIYAPRTRLVDVYVNDSGNLGSGNYVGVYSLQEEVTQGAERLDFTTLEKDDRAGDALTGGYLLRIGFLNSGDAGFRSPAGLPQNITSRGASDQSQRPFYTFESPAESELSQVQRDYITGYIDDLEAALGFAADGSGPTGPPSPTYRNFLDIESAIDFHLMTAFSKDPDSLRLKTYLIKERGEKLKFGPISDQERAFSASDEDRSEDPRQWNPPSTNNRDWTDIRAWHWWGQLFQDPDFSQAYRDRWRELREGEFSNTAMEARINALSTRVEDGQVRNNGLYGQDNPNTDPVRTNVGNAAGWEAEVAHLINWVVDRADWMDETLGVANSRVPTISPAGGSTTSGTVVNISPTVGVLYFTTDGSDPRLAGGSPNPNATMRTGTAMTTITSTTTVTARNFFNSVWSAPRVETFVVGTSASPTSLVISEIMYHPAPPAAGETGEESDFEYLELRNTSAQSIDLAGVTISRAIDHRFDDSLIIPANGTIVLARNSAAFQTRYSGVTPQAQWDSGELSDSGDRIIITAADGQLIADFSYDDEEDEGWPLAADGGGQSLTLDNLAGGLNPTLSSSWRASVSAQGSPGQGFDDFCEEWKSAFFTAAEMNNAAISGDNADPDGDGIVNLLELGLGLSPIVADPAPLIVADRQDLQVGGVSGTYFTITYARQAGVSGLSVVPAYSNMLQNPWTQVGVLLSTRDLGDGREEVVYRDAQPLPTAGVKRFGRIEVVKN